VTAGREFQAAGLQTEKLCDLNVIVESARSAWM